MTTQEIKTALKARRITNREYAAKLGTDEPTVSRWLNGKRQPRKVTMTALELVYKLHFENPVVEHEGQII